MDKFRRGEVTAACVLVDHLEENSLPHAKRVRGWDKYRQNELFWQDVDMSRQKLMRWQRLAQCQDLRAKIGRLFGRRWKPLSLAAFSGTE